MVGLALTEESLQICILITFGETFPHWFHHDVPENCELTNVRKNDIQFMPCCDLDSRLIRSLQQHKLREFLGIESMPKVTEAVLVACHCCTPY